MDHLTTRLAALRDRLDADDGFSTAELLGNAALGVIALVAIWTLLQSLGVDVVNFVRAQMMGGGG